MPLILRAVSSMPTAWIVSTPKPSFWVRFKQLTPLALGIGGMAKSVNDLNSLVSAMMQRPRVFDISGGLSGIRIGFLDPRIWNIPEELCSWPNDTRDQMVWKLSVARSIFGRLTLIAGN